MYEIYDRIFFRRNLEFRWYKMKPEIMKKNEFNRQCFRDGDFRRPLQSAADTDDQWRRDDRSIQPSTNGWGGDGGRRFDDRGGRFDDRFDRGGSRFDDRRRDRYDDRGFGRYDDQRGGDRYDDRRDYRGGRYDNTRGDRGFGSGFRDGPRGGYRDDGRGRYDDYSGRGGYDRGGRGPDAGARGISFRDVCSEIPHL